MRAFLGDHLIISVYTATLALLMAGCAWYVDTTQKQFEHALTQSAEKHAASLARLATITDNNEADEYTSDILRDCPQRAEFESLLSGLGTASKRDLIATQQLFESCGSFYAERKALMVGRMEDEYRALEEATSLLTILGDLDVATRKSLRLAELIELERTRSALLTEQVLIQENIISALISDAGMAVVQTHVDRAHEVNKSLTILDAQIDELRVDIVEASP